MTYRIARPDLWVGSDALVMLKHRRAAVTPSGGLDWRPKAVSQAPRSSLCTACDAPSLGFGGITAPHAPRRTTCETVLKAIYFSFTTLGRPRP